jgi:hypothetical protein
MRSIATHAIRIRNHVGIVRWRVGRPCFQQEHALGMVFAQPVRENRARGPATDDDDVE